ncbi:MAG: hypothetical protein IJJ82_00790 [Clostridia bacterium]|nr:hypothetical protein [Clostridia bacterium]
MKTNFDSIPEGATDEEINMYLKAFLNEKDDMIKEKGIIYTFEQLEKIAENENDTLYYGYEEKYINEIKNFIENNLDYNNYELIDIILTIVINMNLDSIWNMIIAENNLTNQDVIELIEDVKKENSEYNYFPKY